MNVKRPVCRLWEYQRAFRKEKTKIARKELITHSENNCPAKYFFFFKCWVCIFLLFHKKKQSCWISTYTSPPQKVYWQVASNIFPKARIKRTVCKSLSSQYSHKNSNRNSHPIPSWKLRESASETSSDNGINRKRQRCNNSVKWLYDTKSHILHDSRDSQWPNSPKYCKKFVSMLS